jgi:3-deoxy-manno-octulosonate cytidylyltransferase (CMP-KDO synthetase)
MKKIIIVPARLKSKRLPKKVLADIGGKTLLERCLDHIRKVAPGYSIYVATGDPGIVRFCADLGVIPIFTKKKSIGQQTDPRIKNGTERVAEACAILNRSAIEFAPYDLIINVQADNLFFPKEVISHIEKLAQYSLRHHVETAVFTPITTANEEQTLDINTPKVAIDEYSGRAFYFSRRSIPYGIEYPFVHIGVYGYFYNALMEYARFPQLTLEKSEGLEQLRFLAMNANVATFRVRNEFMAINTADDLERARRYYGREDQV